MFSIPFDSIPEQGLDPPRYMLLQLVLKENVLAHRRDDGTRVLARRLYLIPGSEPRLGNQGETIIGRVEFVVSELRIHGKVPGNYWRDVFRDKVYTEKYADRCLVLREGTVSKWYPGWVHVLFWELLIKQNCREDKGHWMWEMFPENARMYCKILLKGPEGNYDIT